MDNEKENKSAQINIKKSTAIREATVEFLSENRAEILKRAKAKLVAQGIKIEDSEIG